MLQVDLTLLDNRFMHTLGMGAGALLPRGNRSFIQVEGSDDCLERTAMHEQSQHQGDQIHCSAQAVEGSACGGAEGPTADLAVIALLLLAEDADIALAEQSSCWAVQVVAKLGLRVHVVALLTRFGRHVRRRCHMIPLCSSLSWPNHP